MTHLPPVGTHPDADTMLIGALLWSRLRFEARFVMRAVRSDDFATPAAGTIAAAIRTLVEDESRPYGPQLVLDELQRIGAMNKSVAKCLESATTSGVDTAAPVRHYAAAMLSKSLRRRVESAGVALSSASATAGEAELAHIVSSSTAAINDCLARLQRMRGGDDE